MGSSGYTLVEALTALLMIGLAMAGITQAVHVIGASSGHLRLGADRADDLAAVQAMFHDLAPDTGPFRTIGGRPEVTFTGNSTAAVFDCNEGLRCSIDLQRRGALSVVAVSRGGARRSATMDAPASARLAYVSAFDGSDFGAWPSGRDDDRLALVILYQGQDPIAVLPITPEEPGDCAFDVGRGACLPSLETKHGG